MANDLDAPSGRLRGVLTALLGAIAAGGALDLALDRPSTPWSFHVLFEVALLAFVLGAVAYLWWGWWRTHRTLGGIRSELRAHAAERDAWRRRAQKLLRGLGEAMDEQFRSWSLTPAEREVALLLLKGYSTREIAALQGRSERTVRQHAVAVYRKSGLSGRAELSAFFLEDLLLPHEQREAPEARETSSAG